MTNPQIEAFPTVPSRNSQLRFRPFASEKQPCTRLNLFAASAARAALTATTFLLVAILSLPQAVNAQNASGRQIGTIKAIGPNKLTIQTDAGQSCAVTVVDEARIMQLAPGSTDLKTAQTIALRDIETGDRVLVTGHQDAADAFTASRVILMKSLDIAQKHEAEQEDWQKRGAGGLVSAIDPASGTISVTSRTRSIAVQTSSRTVFRRYAGDSVKYQDAVAGSLGQIRTGDQVRVRGGKSEDGASIQAEEIVSGAFRNLAGTIASIDTASDTLTIKDVATKKTFSIRITANSNIHALPPEAAARFAARAKVGQTDGGPSAARAGVVAEPGGASRSTGPGQGGAGGDLSQIIARLPQGSLADLHVGGALMVVATQPQADSISLTAITLLSGVEPILAATPGGSPSMTLSPWNFGGADSGGA